MFFSEGSDHFHHLHHRFKGLLAARKRNTFMPSIRLICWNAAEAKEKAAALESAGYQVDFEPFSPEVMRRVRQDPPAAVVIDLSRLPSQGRDVAVQLRQFKSSRLTPQVLCGGDPLKLPKIRELLPDAVYTAWENILPALEQALRSPLTNVAVPESSFAGYAGAPLVKKLGIRPHQTVGLLDPPPGFEQNLPNLPEGVTWCGQPGAPCDLVIWFVRTYTELVEGLPMVQPGIGKAGLWVMWPKKTSGVESDLTQVIVRKTGLAAGLVDYKVSAIDKTWTGLRFAVRKPRSEV
jgi:CheY-like chemotaxis protein